MKLALVGPTGFVGSALLAEALARGHQVTALSRHPESLSPAPKLAAVKADVYDPQQVADAVRGHDAVLSAFNPGWQEPEIRQLFVDGSRAIVEGLKRAAVRRLIVVGGAGSLYVAPGLQLVDTPEFPEAWKAGALGARQALDELRAEPDLDWTFFSPAVFLDPGPKQGGVRLGDDEPLMKDGAPAHLSVGDLAAVLLDEVEQPRHVRRRFTAGY